MNTAGIDIGATQLRAAIFDENRKMIQSYKTGNDASITCEENVDKLLDFLKSYDYEYAGIGIGCPGPMDIPAGRLLNPPNLVGWDDFHLVRYVEEQTGLKTVLNNDANVSGLAEALLGAGKGYESVVFIGVSTGLGGAFVYKGELVNGAHSNAAEFWNVIVNEDPHCHKNANAGSLNEQAGGSGLALLATDGFGREMTTKELFDLYYQHDPLAIQIVEHGADALAKGLADLTFIIDPDVFVVGGSVAIYNPTYIDLTLEYARRYTHVPINIKYAQFGDDAGLIGASLLIH